MTASAAPVTAAVNQMAAEYGTRDLPFKEVAKPAAAPRPASGGARPEPQHAVYVVNGSTRPATTLVTQIEIQHR